MPARILRVNEAPRLDQGTLTFKTDKVIVYMVDTPGPPAFAGGPPTTIAHGPFQLQIASEVFTSELAKRQVDEAAAHIEQLFPAG